METSFWKKHRMLVIALLYTAVLLNYLSACRIISPQTLVPFGIFSALLIASRLIPADSGKGLRHVRWTTALFFCGFLTHFYLNLMSSGAFYARMKPIGLLNILFHTAVYMLLYVGTDSLRRAIVLGGGLFGLLGVANHYVWLFRGTPIGVEDLTSMRTAVGVAGNYDYTPDRYIILLGLLLLVWTAALYRLGGDERVRGRRIKFKQSCALASVFLFAGLPFVGYGSYYKANSNAFNYDLYLANTLATLCQKGGMEFPEYYSAKAVETIADESAAARAARQQKTGGVKPNIVAIMSESYGDLRVLGDLQTNIPVTPFFDSLKESENAVTGYAYSSIFGSKTANSEFEFLSSDSTLFIPDTMVYLHYFNDLTRYDSLVSVLKGQGYTTSAMHPYLRAGWNRPAVYSKMGFDETMFLEDMKNVEYYRQYPSDAYNFDLIRQRFENKKEGEKLFLFDITMQNHGGYEGEGNGYEQTVSIVGQEGKFPKAEMFLSEQHESDRALSELVTYFANYKEPTVIVFFGDHQPKLDGEFYNWVNPAMSTDAAERMKKHMVPFFFWANYDIPAQTDVHTSINYLAPMLLDTLGLPMSGYQSHLLEQRKVWPVVSVKGIFDYTGKYHKPQEALENSGMLRSYQDLTINHTVDWQGTLPGFFSLGGANDDSKAAEESTPVAAASED